MIFEKHHRPGSGPVLLTGLLAALNAVACGGGQVGDGDGAPQAPTAVAKAATTYHTVDEGGIITLKDRQGNPIPVGSTAPYSTEKTCGGCHDFSLITQGYHFQQGKGRSNSDIYVADNFNPGKPWLLSDGMYGKW